MQPATKPNLGFTLVELLVALIVSSLVLVGIGAAFTATLKTQKLKQELNQQTDALEFITNSFFQLSRGIKEVNSLNADVLDVEIKPKSFSCFFSTENAGRQKIFRQNNRLICEINNQQKTLAYNLTSFNLTCATKQTNQKLNFTSCNSYTNSAAATNLAAIKITYTLANPNFSQVNQPLERSFVIPYSHKE